jgi:hypothetical protein
MRAHVALRADEGGRRRRCPGRGGGRDQEQALLFFGQSGGHGAGWSGRQGTDSTAGRATLPAGASGRAGRLTCRAAACAVRSEPPSEVERNLPGHADDRGDAAAAGQARRLVDPRLRLSAPADRGDLGVVLVLTLLVREDWRLRGLWLAALAACTLYQAYRMYPYTPLHAKQVRTAAARTRIRRSACCAPTC